MRNILSLNKDWLFIKNINEAPATMPETGERVDLPHTWNGIDGQDGGNDYFRGTCCYSKLLLKSDLPEGDRHFLEINGANSSADVYMNGKIICHHDGGYSTFRVDITSTMREENCLTILVDNSINETVYPQTADFTFYGGIYRNVNIIGVKETHFALVPLGTPGIRVTPVIKENHACVEIKTQIVEMQSGDKVSFCIKDGLGNLVCEERAETDTMELVIPNVHLWDGLQDPYLYTATATIFRNSIVIDKVSTRFGCRSFEIDAERGFILNGREYPLRGVARHQDRKDVGNALLPEHHVEDMELIKEVGANTIRLAHYQHDQFFYDLCDEYGMVVWAEIPYISRHMSGGNENTVTQMKELITQCYNHPSIVVWGLSNEITMDGAKNPDMIKQHYVLNNLVHEMDATRPTTIACITMCGIDEEYVHIPDVVSYNHYFGWYGGSFDEYGPWFDKFHEKYPDKPIGISEYGCEALNWHNSKPESGDYSEEYQAMYHEALIRQISTRKYLWATHLWSMFDFGADARAEGGENGQNHKGLVTIDRKYKKDSFYAYKACWSKEPFVHIGGKHYVDRVEEVTKVKVYSNLEEVKLFANGELLECKSHDFGFFYYEVPNIGETKLVASVGEWKDESVIRKVETFNQDYILREQGAVLNWFDITEIEGRFSLNDKIGEITKTLKGKIWMLEMFLILAKKQSGPKTKKSRKNGSKNKTNVDGNVMNMINSFTVLRFTGMLGMRNISFTKEELLKMNRKLNRIRKPRVK